jgi:ADP-heptose:LPS heptosyltransferase
MLAMPGITWYSLQKDDGEDEIAAVAAARKLVLLDARRDFDRKAALMNALDLVISVDTSTAHLAGALARPLWVLLPFAPDWRWLLARSDSPWYPTARLFRQPRVGDWTTVIDEVSHALAALIATRR